MLLKFDRPFLVASSILDIDISYLSSEEQKKAKTEKNAASVRGTQYVFSSFSVVWLCERRNSFATLQYLFTALFMLLPVNWYGIIALYLST